MDFIQRFIEFTREYESPTSFWRWSAYALVAAILRDNCFYHHGIRKTYPNIYVVLLAESAEYRKSGPFSLVSTLTQELKNTKIIEGRASVQGIIDDLAQDLGIKNASAPIRGGSCIILAEELAAFFVNDPQLIPLITSMYDFKAVFPYKLRSSNILVKNLCLTMLAASNSTFLRDVYTTAANYGGLLGRTLMIRPDETRPPNSLLEVDIDKYKLDDLLKCLSEIKKLSGRFDGSKAAKTLYDEWYKELYKSYKKYPDAMGISQRMHSNVLKLAMIIAAANHTLEIQLDHMEEAILQVTSIRSNYEGYAMGMGKSDQAEIGQIFLMAIWDTKDKRIKRKDFLFKHWNDVPAEELDKLVTTLEQAGLILQTVNGNDLYYEMTNKCIGVFEKKV